MARAAGRRRPDHPDLRGGRRSPVAAGTRPAGLVLGLFTADANPDLAIADEGTGSGNSVATLLTGNGAGGLASPSTTTVGNGPAAIASGLFDAGTTLDLVVANEGSDTVSILRGNGNGTFATATSVAVGDHPVAVAVGDIDNDTKPDIATANTNDDNVSILKGNGTGGFSSLAAVSAGNKPAAVALARINADANLDLLTANEGADTVTLRLGNGNGTFGLGEHPHRRRQAEGNRDRRPQPRRLGRRRRHQLRLQHGLGPARKRVRDPHRPAERTLDRRRQHPSGNRHRRPERGCRPGPRDRELRQREGLCAPRQRRRHVRHPGRPTTGTAPAGIATGDLNGDARTDVLVANRTANTVTVLLNTTPATVSVAAPATLSFGAATVGATLGPIAQSVTVVSNARGGYQLSASRSVFTRGDLPLGVSAASAPAGALLDLAAGTSSIPTSGSRNIGHRSLTVTRSAGDVWSLGLSLGPVPFVADGAHTSTLTYTVVGLP